MKMYVRSVSVACACLTGAFAVSVFSPAWAQTLNVPVMEHASDGLDTCALGHVTGLNAEGDGFLAVRSGPGLEHTKLDELHNGDHVWLFDRRGAWIGIVYAAKDLICSPIENDRPVETDGKTGWVHEDWIQILAG